MDLLSGLNPVQRAAVEMPEGPVLVVAGAGSGKTRVLVYRIAYLLENGIAPESIIAITFTNKAAGEMRSRVADLIGPTADEIWVSTFHSACVRILRREAPRLGYANSFSIYDSSDSLRLIRMILKDLNIDEKRLPPRGVAAAISNAKNKLMDAGLFSDFADNPYEKRIALVYTEYEKRLAEQSAFDFDDLIMRTVEVFDKHPDALARYQGRFRHVLIDEFQDTNHAQSRLATLLAGKWRNIFVVGDADQGIYAFRGATIKNLLDFERDWPEAKVITLEQNYRSTRTILDAANAVIENNAMRKPKALWTAQEGGERIVRYHGSDEHDEAAWVAQEVRKLSDQGHPHADVAVFYRTNAQSRVLEEAFNAASLPYRVVGGVGFYDRKEIKDMMAWLRAAMNPLDTISAERICGAPKRGIGPGSISKIQAFAASRVMPLGNAFDYAEEVDRLNKKARGGALEIGRILAHIRDLDHSGVPITDIVASTWEITGYMTELQADRSFESLSRQENLKELAGSAAEYDENTQQGSLTDFLELVALVNDTDEEEGEETGVTFMTLHNAKGLEFPIVFIVGMEEAVFPHMRSLADPEQLEEERRLCYVGITRAQERLYLLNAWRRRLWGPDANYNTPSRFLREIPDDLIKEADKKDLFTTRRTSVDKPKSVGGRDLSRFKVGAEIEHTRWGRGIIVDLRQSALGMEATIHFPDMGSDKRLDLTLAPIKVV
ncbi:MAG: AAA family ATPase [Actinobacteria bacterium]|nr:AAA family ATPase [Actinomycetota bacterium]